MSGNFITILNLSNSVISILLVFVMPGFTLSYLLFPKNDFDILERFFITISASIAISSISGFVIILIIGNLQHGILFNALLTVSISFAIGSIIRIIGFEAKENHPDEKELFRSKAIYYFLTYLAISFCLSTIVVRGFIRTESITPHVTEFFIDPDYIGDFIQGNYQNEGKVNIPLVVVNREGEPTSYEIHFVLNDLGILNYPKFLLRDGAKWNKVVTVPINESVPNNKLDIYLYKENGDRIGQLRLWLEH